MADDKKLKLATALENEKNTLPEYNMFGDKNNLHEYDDAITYLRTGKKPYDYDDNDMLLSCIDDIETMYYDYEIE